MSFPNMKDLRPVQNYQPNFEAGVFMKRTQKSILEFIRENSCFKTAVCNVGNNWCCYVRQCSLSCALLLKLSRGSVSHYIIIYYAPCNTQLLSFGFLLFKTLRQYIKRQHEYYKYNYKFLLSLPFNLIIYTNTVNTT